MAAAKPSALVDTRVVYCGDNLDQLQKLSAQCVDLRGGGWDKRGKADGRDDPSFHSNRNHESPGWTDGFWGETKENRAFEDRHVSTKTFLTLLTVLAFLGCSAANATLIQAMEYDEMMAKSDLVVLAVPYRSTVTQDTFPGVSPAESADIYDGIKTDFEILNVFKSDGTAPKRISVLHFLYTLRPPKTHHTVVDGCTFVKFLGEGAPKGREAMTPNPDWGGTNTVWLAFLKGRPDGRYEPVGGQPDASTSFRVLKWETNMYGDAPFTSPRRAKTYFPAAISPGFVKQTCYFLGLLGGLLLVIAPWTARVRGAPRWFRTALWLSGSAAIVWSLLGSALIFPYLPISRRAYSVLYYTKPLISGIAIGVLVLMFVSGEMFNLATRKTNSDGKGTKEKNAGSE